MKFINEKRTWFELPKINSSSVSAELRIVLETCLVQDAEHVTYMYRLLAF